MKVDRIERLLKLIQVLQSGRPYTVQELGKSTGVSQRTVFRDLELLSRGGIEYSYDRATRRYRAEREMLLPPVTLTHGEAFALMLAARYVINRELMTDETVTTSAAMKLESMLPAEIRNHCGPLLEQVVIRPSQSSDSRSISGAISVIQTALVEQRKISAKYDSYFDGKVIDVVLHPWRLAYMKRGWYLIAYTEEVGEPRTYKVERLLQHKVLHARFMMPSEFNLDDYFGNAWLMIRGDTRYHVKIRFLPKVAGNVDEIRWHKTQRTVYQEDGSLVFEVDVDGIEEISWWVLGYGNQAQVLEPAELRDLLAQRIRVMHAYYENDGRSQK